ncbi:MAG: SDR family oxidoreductase [Acidimicrobiales bacterium]
MDVLINNAGVSIPAPIDAPDFDQAWDATLAGQRVPLRRYGDPEEVAQAIASLVLPAASYINGAVLAVDGGLTVQNT